MIDLCAEASEVEEGTREGPRRSKSGVMEDGDTLIPSERETERAVD
jgi:hypothetical protein